MKKIIFLAAATLALAACNNDNIIDEPVAAKITATISNGNASRASGASWGAGDKIGITMGDKYFNMCYTTPDDKGLFTGTAMYFTNHTEPVNFTAYYPFTGTEGTAPGTIEWTVTAEDQTSEKQVEFDFLYAREDGVTGESAKVAFQFSHMMSKLTFIFKSGAGADVSKIASYSVEGLVMDGTFDTATGECKAKATSASPLTFTLTDVKEEEKLPALIVFPQDGSAAMLRIKDSEGQDYECSLPFDNNALESGNNYQFTVTVSKTGLTINKSTITDWNTMESSTGAGSVNPK
ncbi:MAG: fimbrillin family protein [Muribaculaceae bacterium]|nr:fimbrillin family protein [Muribaculaceae bacterium]